MEKFKTISYTRLVVAAIIAGLLLTADYFCCNLSYPLFDSSSRLLLHTYLYDHDKGEESDDDLVAVNVAYDMTLAETYNEFGEPIGFTPITDREKLTRFLKIASQADYRYIFVDVNFPYDLTTSADSALFSQINNMPNIVVSAHRYNAEGDDEFECHPALSPDKLAYADYRLIKGNSFSRYEFLQDGKESVALRMYRDLNQGAIDDRIFGYTDHGRLCYNTQFITLPKRILLSEKETGEIRYPYLTGHFFARHSDEELARMLDGKVIVIGDYDNDMHDTLIGPVPGSMLSYYAYKSLADGKHRVNWWLQMFMFCLYMGLGYWILSATAVSEARWSNRRRQTFTTNIFLYFMGTGVFLGAVDMMIYFIFADSYIIIIPTIVFTLLSTRRRIHYLVLLLNRKFRNVRRGEDTQLIIQS